MNHKILFFANTSWYLVNFRLNLMRQLQSLGYDIIALAPVDDYSARLIENNITYIPINIDNKGTNPFIDSLLIVKLAYLFARQKPNVILSYTPKCNIYGSLSAQVVSIPIINNISGLGTAFIQESLLTQLVKFLYRIALRKSATVFFQNKDDLALFIKHRLVKEKQTALLRGSGVDVNRFIPVNIKRQDTDFIFLCVARLLKDKGIVELVNATRLLKQHYSQVRCQLLGFLDAKNPSAITYAELKKWQDEGIIEYLGISDNVQNIIQYADCVVLPSYREGTPRSLLEAASMAKPIITTNAVGCREVVDDGINGFLCEPRNMQDLKNKMQAMLLLSNEQRELMGLKGREKMLREFDERLVIERYITAIEQY